MTDLKLSPRLAFTITNTGNEKKIKEAFEASGTEITFYCHAHGTAPSAIMELFGLSGREKLVSAGFIDRSKTAALFQNLDEKLSFSQKGHGIAFTLSLSSMQSRIMSLLSRDETQGDEKEMNEQNTTSYVAILAAVTGGYSDDVVEAARNAGARGGTIIKGMREGTHEVSQALGVSLKEEQDFVLILVPKENKKEVMNAITAECGINTEAHGVVSSFNLDEVFGL